MSKYFIFCENSYSSFNGRDLASAACQLKVIAPLLERLRSALQGGLELWSAVTKAPNERWACDMCRAWAGRDGWTTLARVIDCHSQRAAGLASVWQRQVKDSRVGPGAGADRPLRHARPRFRALPHAFEQWAGLRQPQLHSLGLKLRAAAGVHHTA